MARQTPKKPILEPDPLWYKDAIIYELHVRSFSDSNEDGIGDFRGLTGKLDYLQDLGVTAVWLLPFCPSPLKDDGYDISNYTSVHPDYGTLRDFKFFLKQAHRRNIRVITELVLNHTSDQHPWFQRARRAKPGSRWRDFYVWSDNPDRYKEARVIFQDFEASNWSWDPVVKAYYWHRFYSHQPDLNYDNPHVHKAMLKAIDFWLSLGVDGLRLDAVPYLYEREGTNCENLPETHEFLRKVRSYVDSRYSDRMLLAEANQWPEDAIAYLAEGDQSHMAYHFPLMPRLFMALHMEDRFPIVDIMEQTPEIPDSCQWALFLRNHDELTLEMVTDEERDYMHRVYAQDAQMRINLGIRRRLAPLLGNHRRRIELMKGLLFSLPGSPILYYGDEIGMGDNIYLGDRNGVRTPMQWSADRNAGFSKANSQRLHLPVIIDPEYHHQSINVEAQQRNTHSLLWWTKRLIALRKRFRAFGRGSLQFLNPDNRKILAFLRHHENDSILVVANLSRFTQYVELELSELRGKVPVEMFGGSEFPPIGEGTYFLTLGPHSFYWFGLVPQAMEYALHAEPDPSQIPALSVSGAWEAVFKGKSRAHLEGLLPDYLRRQRWFGGKARRIKSARIVDMVPVSGVQPAAFLLFSQVDYLEGDPEIYSLPVTYASGVAAGSVQQEDPASVMALIRQRDGDEQGILYDALLDKAFCLTLLETFRRRHRLKGTRGEVMASQSRAFRQLLGQKETGLDPSTLGREQSNTSVVYGQQLILKLYRRLSSGVNPDLEIGRFLTQKGFGYTPPVAGALEYRKGKDEPITLGVLQGFIPNEGDAWAYSLDLLNHYFEKVMAQYREGDGLTPPKGHFLDMVEEEPSQSASDMIGSYLETARLLGRRTAEMHVFLASSPDDPVFAPEPFSKLYQRALYQSMRNLTGHNFQLLRKSLTRLPETLQSQAKDILKREKEVHEFFRLITSQKITAMRIRCHGDYHLGQVLYTGKDFVIMDFEGEPARPLGERKIKRSPLRDVAGMLRSFHYAFFSSLFSLVDRGLVHTEDQDKLESCAQTWYFWICAIYLKTYLPAAAEGRFLPCTAEELRILLDVYLLEKAIYEMGYELNNRPEWTKIPLRGIEQVLEMGKGIQELRN
jgi:maltose alpha-D-glucosyltransferase/alpha-amylase